MPLICSALDGGNIRVLDASSPANIRLEIEAEPYTEADKTTHFQFSDQSTAASTAAASGGA